MIHLVNPEPVFVPDSVKTAYKEPHRKYHNTSHIEFLLLWIPVFAEHYRLPEEEVKALELAAWYHDVIYDPASSTNEEDSADLFWVHAMKGDIENSYKGTIGAIIRDTETHREPSSWLSAIFLDLDLAGLGTADYAKNAFNIRAEYSHLSDFEWLVGRINFLEDFLYARRCTYHTSLGFSLWNKKATRNMSRELVALHNPSMPNGN